MLNITFLEEHERNFDWTEKTHTKNKLAKNVRLFIHIIVTLLEEDDFFSGGGRGEGVDIIEKTNNNRVEIISTKLQ